MIPVVCLFVCLLVCLFVSFFVVGFVLGLFARTYFIGIFCVFRHNPSPRCPPFYAFILPFLDFQSNRDYLVCKMEKTYFSFLLQAFPIAKYYLFLTAFPKNLERYFSYQHSMVLTFRVCVVHSILCTTSV